MLHYFVTICHKLLKDSFLRKILIFTADINSERGHFLLQISPWKQRRQKKQSRPWRSQRKIPQNCHLRFLIFETLSQRFFAAKLGFFQFFQKRQKEAILFCKFLHENWADRKNGVHHDKANGKYFWTVISDFWFLKICHRDFYPQNSLYFKKLNYPKKFFF